MTQRVLQFAILISAVIAIYTATNDLQSWFTIFKPLTTILILLLPIFTPSEKFGKYRKLIISALIFCLFGDIFLLDHTYFIFGLSSFLIGHILFALAFMSLEGLKKNYLVLLGLLIYGIIFFGFLKPHLGDMIIPVIAYFLVILFMAWQGMAMAFSRIGLWILCAGVILFILSDSVLAINKFVHPFSGASLIILSTYWLAIYLLANSVAMINHKWKVNENPG